MNSSQYTASKFSLKQFVWIAKEVTADIAIPQQTASHTRFTPLQPIRHWLDNIEIHSLKTAKVLCQLIPARCPFERTIKLFGYTLLHIPPLCKLNPVYEQVVGLRFRALCYLADECGEDISRYC